MQINSRHRLVIVNVAHWMWSTVNCKTKSSKAKYFDNSFFRRHWSNNHKSLYCCCCCCCCYKSKLECKFKFTKKSVSSEAKEKMVLLLSRKKEKYDTLLLWKLLFNNSSFYQMNGHFDTHTRTHTKLLRFVSCFVTFEKGTSNNTLSWIFESGYYNIAQSYRPNPYYLTSYPCFTHVKVYLTKILKWTFALSPWLQYYELLKM